MHEYALPIFKERNIPVRWFENASKAAEYLKTTLKHDDLLFVKGSQNTLLLEIAIEQLMAQPETAEKVLCRRGDFWDKERAKLTQQSRLVVEPLA